MANRFTKGKALVGALYAKAIFLNGVAFTTANAAAALLNGVTAGTVAASKGVVVDANKALTGLVFKIGGAVTTSPGAPVSHIGDNTANVSSTVQNQEDVLNTVDLPASGLNASTMNLIIRAFGSLAANGNAKTLKLYFGSTVIATLAGSTANAKAWAFEAFVVRTGLSAQTIYGRLTIDGTIVYEGVVTATETETAAITVKQTGANTAAAAASGTGKGLQVLVLH